MGPTADAPRTDVIPQFGQILGHPKPLWMLFMAEFWERFAFYGIRWALVLYIVAQFHGGSATGQADANRTYGAYLALVYAAAIFGGYIADKILGYQRSILTGAVFMAAGLFLISMPSASIFKLGLATIIVGNGMFKPIISTIVGRLYSLGDERRDSGFTIFYMGINAGRVRRADRDAVARAVGVRHRRGARLQDGVHRVGRRHAGEPRVVLHRTRAAPGHRRRGAGQSGHAVGRATSRSAPSR